ncbi:MAG: thaumatin family protein [Legionellaceae bacterium]|nr:thaumatin family protein [Legionellaceae bacterium]
MKKGLWIGIGLLILCNPMFAAKPTMQLVSQPSGAVYSLPATFGVYNLAPVPENICSPTISAGTQSATCSGLPVCRGAQVQKASFTCSVTTTCNHTVSANKAGGSCSISVNVIKPSSLPASTAFSFKLSYGSYNALLISNSFLLNGTNPLPPASSYRTITFKNSCNYPIWFGSITAAAPTKNVLTGSGIDCTGTNAEKLACVNAGGACYARIDAPDACLSQACSSDADCVSGASCYASTGTCFWNNPSPSNQSFELPTPGSMNTVQIPEYESNGLGIVWSGAFGGRTGCTTGTCTSALCTAGSENAEGVCSLGVGFQQPATQAEPTFITYATGTTPTLYPDAYDVTTINGANVPMSMYPTGAALPTAGNNPYTCGFAGYNLAVPVSEPAGDTIGASSWSVSTYAPNVAYRYVVPSSSTLTRCTIDGDCSSGQYCGLSYASGSIGSTTAPGSGYLVCGAFAGWFTADQVCGTNNNFTTAIGKDGTTIENFFCNTALSSPGGTMSNLYQCNAPYAHSCYSSDATTSCCGCVDWGSDGTILQVPTNTSYVTACVQKNTNWTQSFSSTQPQVYDTVLFLKQSCPSCYVYPFDDASSSFTCTNGNTTTDNTEDYTVEYCPGGNGNTGFQP